MIRSTTIVFITGAYVSHTCWNEWQHFFQQKGYNCMAPPWPEKEGTAALLREKHPDKKLASVTMAQIIERYEQVISLLPEKPIVIGHSFGGLFAQILLNRKLAAAAVAIHAVPPQGIIPFELNFLRSNFATLGLFSSLNQPYLMPLEKWRFVFTNGMSLIEQETTYDALVIPESRRAARGGLTSAAYVNFKLPHEPLLLLAGTDDHCIPESLCRRVYNAYKDKNSVTEYIVNKRNHFVLGAQGWERDAELVYQWIKEH